MTASARARMYDLRAVLWCPAFRDHHIHTVGFWMRRIAVGWTPRQVVRTVAATPAVIAMQCAQGLLLRPACKLLPAFAEEVLVCGTEALGVPAEMAGLMTAGLVRGAEADRNPDAGSVHDPA